MPPSGNAGSSRSSAGGSGVPPAQGGCARIGQVQHDPAEPVHHRQFRPGRQADRAEQRGEPIDPHRRADGAEWRLARPATDRQAEMHVPPRRMEPASSHSLTTKWPVCIASRKKERLPSWITRGGVPRVVQVTQPSPPMAPSRIWSEKRVRNCPQHGGAGGRVSGADGGRLGQHHQRFPQPLDEAAEPGGGIPRQPERLVPGRLGTLGAQLDLRCHQQ